MSSVWKKRYVSTCFRDDSYISKLWPMDKLLFLYFLTNPLSNVAWIYEISIKRMCFDTWLTKVQVEKTIKKFSKDDKIFHIDDYLYIKNFKKHQNLENSKIKKWVENVMSTIPKSITDKIWAIYESYMSHAWPSNNLDFDSDSDLDSNPDSDLDIYNPTGDFDYGFVDKFIETQSKHPSIKYQIQKQGKDKYKGSQYKVTDLLIKDWFTMEQIQLAMLYVLKDDFWNKNIQSVKKLRDKNKDWVPYIVVMLDKAKERIDKRTKSNFIFGINNNE